MKKLLLTFTFGMLLATPLVKANLTAAEKIKYKSLQAYLGKLKERSPQLQEELKEDIEQAEQEIAKLKVKMKLGNITDSAALKKLQKIKSKIEAEEKIAALKLSPKLAKKAKENLKKLREYEKLLGIFLK